MSTTWSGIVDLPPARHVPLVGRVGEFDEARGLGVVEYGQSRRFPFHCTAITDGSRQIAVGTLVAIEVSTGRLGHLEAVSVRPLVGMSAGRGAVDEASEPEPEPELEFAPEPEPVPEVVEAVVEVAGVAVVAEVAVVAVAPEVKAGEPVRAKLGEDDDDADALAEATRWTVIEPASWSDSSIQPVDPSPAEPGSESAPWPAAEPDAWSEPTAQSVLVKRSPVEWASEASSASSPDVRATLPAESRGDWSADPWSASGEISEPTGVPSIDPMGITPPAGVATEPSEDSVAEPERELEPVVSAPDPVRGPDFWSIPKSEPTGPPPTWMTPVTPGSEGSAGSAGSASEDESDPSSSS